MTWAGFDWATGHKQESLRKPLPASLNHSNLCNACKKKEALFKIKLLTTDREAVAPAHTLFTVLNWHSFKSWEGPRAADSKTFQIKMQKLKGFVPFWLLASFLGLLCLPMLNVNQQSRSTFAKKS